MSYPPPSMTPYADVAPEESRYSPMGAWIAWILIVIGVGYIVVSVMKPQLKGKSAPVANNVESMNADLTIRLTLGEYDVFNRWGILQPATKAQLVTQVRNALTADSDKLKVVPLVGEIQGKEAALTELNLISVPATQSTTSTSQPMVSLREVLHKIYSCGTSSITSEERASVEQMGFAGKIALAFEEGEHKNQAAVFQDSRRMFIGMIAWFSVMALLSVAGFVLLIVAAIFLSTGTMKLTGLPKDVPGTPFVEGFALYLVLFFVGSIVISLMHLGGLAWNMPLILILPCVFLYVHWRGESWQNVFKAFGWHKGHGVVREILAGVIGYIAGLPVLIAGFYLAVKLMNLTGSKPSHPITAMVNDVPWWMLYLLASVWAPILEETMFRGALLHHLRRVMPWIGAAPIVSLIFAMIHPQGLAFIPALGAIAMMLAALREWRGSIIAPMVAHGLSNAATVTLLLIMMK